MLTDCDNCQADCDNCPHVEPAAIKMPERNEYFEKVAVEVVGKLDLTFSRDEVKKITRWALYLSTQD